MDEKLTQTPSALNESAPHHGVSKPKVVLCLIIILVIVAGIFYFKNSRPIAVDINPVVLREATPGKLVAEFPPELIILSGTEVLESKLVRLEVSESPGEGNQYASTKLIVPVSPEVATSEYVSILQKQGYITSAPTTGDEITIKARQLNEITRVWQMVRVTITGSQSGSTIVINYSKNTQK